MELCNKCAEKRGETASIDINLIGETLSPGEIWSGAICEECEIIAISKTDDGAIQVMKLVDDGNSTWESI
jgi:hypothetical protein